MSILTGENPFYIEETKLSVVYHGQEHLKRKHSMEDYHKHAAEQHGQFKTTGHNLAREAHEKAAEAHKHSDGNAKELTKHANKLTKLALK